MRWAGVVPNAIDVDALGPERARGDYLVQLARIVPEKGQHHAIAVARATKRTLVLAGPIDWRSEAKPYFAEHVRPAIEDGTVVYHPNVAGDEKRRLLAQAHAYLSPVPDEAFGLAMGEALVCGTPVIAFRSDGAREIMRDGTPGTMVEDERGMIEAVESVRPLDDEQIAGVRRRFSPATMAERYAEVYRRALS